MIQTAFQESENFRRRFAEVGLFNTTIEESPTWLHDVMEETGLDQHDALQALRGVLHALHEEITADQSGHLVARCRC